MRALFETLPLHPHGRLTLLYRASTPADVILKAELDQIAAKRGAEIIGLIGPSSAPDLQLTAANLTQLIPDIADRDVYLCASPGLSAAARAGLRETGHPSRHLHEETFTF